MKYSSQTGATATFSFTGAGVRWIAAKSKSFGKAGIYIDDVYLATVDLYSSTAKVKQIVYGRRGLAQGAHSIKVEVLGQKNPASTGYIVDVDAFE